ncbi:MAG: hypothetical protein ACK5TH_01535 [Prosthecobacter sp.]
MLLAIPAGGQVVSLKNDATAKALNEWFAAGTAAGLSAITYENRDGQHSPFPTQLYPQLQVMKAVGDDKGPAKTVRSFPVIGNCSMASAPDQVGCLPRLYMTDPAGSEFLTKQYFLNNLFIYPEHLDHDQGANGVGGYGDLLPLNTPTLLISQGSSSSDQPFLQAFISAAAAFPPATQKVILEKKLLAPTLQAIFRRSNKMVVKEEDYFTGRAHPVVFDAAQIDEAKMIQLAHEMTPETIPPVALIDIKEETKVERGKQWFEPQGMPAHTSIATTPVSIGRIFRENTAEHGLIVSLDKSFAATPRKLSAKFAVLQGDPRFLRIDQQPGTTLARIRVRWQPPVPGARGIRSHRIDIAAFATDGKSISAPAIISFYMLPNEMRFYDPQGRVSEIHYETANPEPGLPYEDRDLRWTRLMNALAAPLQGSLLARLTAPLFTDAEREAILKAQNEIQKRLEAAATVARDPKLKAEADKLRGEALDHLAKTLDQPLPGEKPRILRVALLVALEVMASDPLLFIQNQAEILDFAAKSSKTTAPADLRAEIHRLSLLGILHQEKDGTLRTSVFPKKLTIADRQALRGLHLTVLSHVLLPDVLDRSPATAWFPPRLTTRKPWRDIMRYDDATGQLTGWTRHHDARTTEFNAEGQLIPPGEKTKPIPVTYLLDAGGKLTWKADGK